MKQTILLLFIFNLLLTYFYGSDSGWWSLTLSGGGFNTLKWLSIIPVAVYSNADVLKKTILKENKDKSGIYRWTNLINNKSYIGRSICLDKRFISYFNVLSLENTPKFFNNRYFL